MLNVFIRNGGLYVKLGQGLCTMNHVLPRPYIDTLDKLHDQAFPHKPGEVRKIFMEDFGEAPEEVFESFDPEPFAAASLAQVHRARTKSGDDVAVKIQYSDLRQRFNGDMGTMKFLLSLNQIIHPKFDLAWVLHEVESALIEELDFEKEAQNGIQCKSDLKFLGTNRENGKLHIPEVYTQLSSKRILTTEYIDGVKINEMKILKEMNFDFKEIDTTLITAFSHQVFCSGFVHADPHPGNVLIKERKLDTIEYLYRTVSLWCTRVALLPLWIMHLTVWSPCFSKQLFDAKNPVQIVLIDHGLYEKMLDTPRQHLCKMYIGILWRDADMMKKQAELLNVDDWSTFAGIILQRPWERSNMKISGKISKAELEYIRMHTAHRIDKIMSVLRQVPKPLLLFIRNLNITRAICREHGDLVDRYSTMIEAAYRGVHYDNESQSIDLYHEAIARINSNIYHFFLNIEGLQLWLMMKLFASKENERVIKRLRAQLEKDIDGQGCPINFNV